MAYQEDNHSVKENIDSKEMNKTPAEIPEVKEQATALEFKAQSEDASSGLNKAKLTKTQRMTAEAATATAVIGLASFVVIASSGLINVTMNGEINEIVFQDNGIQYSINVSDVQPDNNLYFTVFDGSKELAKYEIVFAHDEVYEGELTGYISIADLNIKDKLANSKDGKLEYDFHLCGDTGLIDRTYDSWSLGVESFTSEFKSVTHKCDCKVSGNYLFTMDFVDDNNYYTDFAAYIIDSAGARWDCNFSSNLHEQQKILVVDAAGGAGTLNIVFNRDGEEVNYSYDITI